MDGGLRGRSPNRVGRGSVRGVRTAFGQGLPSEPVSGLDAVGFAPAGIKVGREPTYGGAGLGAGGSCTSDGVGGDTSAEPGGDGRPELLFVGLDGGGHATGAHTQSRGALGEPSGTHTGRALSIRPPLSGAALSGGIAFLSDLVTFAAVVGSG
jgi:hypothetical protein